MDHKDLPRLVQVFAGTAENATLISSILKKVGIEGMIMDEKQSNFHHSESGERKPRILKVMVPLQQAEEATEIIHAFENLGHH